MFKQKDVVEIFHNIFSNLFINKWKRGTIYCKRLYITTKYGIIVTSM